MTPVLLSERGIAALVADPTEDTTRREFITGVGAATLAAAFLAACGNEEDAAGASERADGAFPTSVAHKYGTTEIPRPPERVVSIGYNDQDFLLAFGVAPIAVRYWFGDAESQVYPWAEDELGDRPEPDVLDMPELDIEQIAALEPDLITAVYSDISEEEYRLLSQIAPTVAQSGDYPDYAVPWQEMTRTVAQALGQSDRAKTLIEAITDQCDEIRAAHPEFEGATISIVRPGDPGSYGVVAPADHRAQLLSELGFVFSEAIAGIAQGEFSAFIGGEQLQLIDTDVLVWLGAAPEDDPVYEQLAVAREQRTIVLSSGSDLGAAFGFTTVLSLPFLLEGLTPALESALQGTPVVIS